MNKHTKEPWHIVEGRTHGSLEVFSVDTAIAEIWRRGNKALEMANARLIAAAPELLEALQDALGDLEFLKNAPDSAYARPDDETIKAVRAAIAKAGGES